MKNFRFYTAVAFFLKIFSSNTGLHANENPLIFITENGVATEDVLSEKNTISDEERISFYKRYLISLNKAINDGADVRGFYAWSFTDNFEWHRGYDMRFGMVYIDYENQKRILKDSFFFYKNLIESSVIS